MFVAILTSISALVLMLAFPETPTGKWLHRTLVEGPAVFLTDFTWAKLGRTLLIVGAVALLALMGPEMMLLMAATGLDAAALLEVMLIVWLASVSGSVLGAWRTLMRFTASSIRLVRAAAGSRNRARIPRRRKCRPQRKNEDEHPGWAFA
jgi:hypothetical protein